jgi:hypothetical protein
MNYERNGTLQDIVDREAKGPSAKAEAGTDKTKAKAVIFRP